MSGLVAASIEIDTSQEYRRILSQMHKYVLGLPNILYGVYGRYRQVVLFFCISVPSLSEPPKK